MALTVNTNVASLNVQKNLGRASDALSNSMTRLSSGLRINSAQDELARLSIADKVKSQMENSNRPIRFATDTIALLQTGEGALNETHSMLIRMRDLATQSVNQSYSDSDRSLMQSEFADVAKHITTNGNYASFNGHSILNGSYEIQTQSAAFFDESRSIKINDMRSEALGVSDLSISTVEGGKEAISKIDEALKMVDEQRTIFGKEGNYLVNQIFSMTSRVNNTSPLGRIHESDFASETANLVKQKVLQQAGQSVLAQANSLPSAVLKLLQ